MKIKLVIWIFLIVILCWVSTMALFSQGHNMQLSDGEVRALDQGWTYTDENGQSMILDLPEDLDAEKNQSVSISRVLTEDFPMGQSLLIRASLQNLTVMLDDQILVQTTEGVDSLLHTPYASAWYIVALPDDVAGKTLTITLTSHYSAFSGCLNSISYGEGIDCMYHLILLYRSGLILTGIIAVIGIIMVLASVLIRDFYNRSWLYLGLFSLGVAAWLFAESKLSQFFIGNQMLIGGLAYIALSLFPIPILLYLKEEIVPDRKKIINAFVLAFLIDFAAITILQAVGLRDFFETAPITLALLAATIILFVTILLHESIRKKNRSATHFLAYISVLVVFGMIEIILFYFSEFETTSHFLRYGMLAFIIMIAVDTAVKMKSMMRRHNEAEFYEKMAYRDILTLGRNRAAFERDIDLLRNHDQPQRVRLVMMDLNRLKYINDTFGHDEGDRAIKICFDCMTETFGADTRCYRFGGDEFVCIMNNHDLDYYNECKARFLGCIAKKSENLDYSLSVAIGSSVYHADTNDDFSEFFRQMDRAMYQNKQTYKQNYECI